VFIQSRAGIALIIAVFTFMNTQCPMRADSSLNLPFPCPTVNGKSVIDNSDDKSSVLIAQAGTAAEVADIAAVDSVVSKKPKFELLITDSLWGNLILDMAYQRDAKLRQLYRQFGIVNIGTMAAVAGIAGGTLAQGVVALATLNPRQGNDTYLPGAIGIGMSGLTIVTFVGRAAINHHLAKCLRNRQLEIKHQVEAVLAHLEKGDEKGNDSKKELVDLIGERAANEWLQLWRSSNAVASLKLPSVSSLSPSALIANHHQ
jgi:hypothetical protein